MSNVRIEISNNISDTFNKDQNFTSLYNHSIIALHNATLSFSKGFFKRQMTPTYLATVSNFA